MFGDSSNLTLSGQCNLKPANMRGVKSFAMVLCVRAMRAFSPHLYERPNETGGNLQATSKGGKEAGIELIQPPAGSKPGDKIYFEGPDFESKRLIP